MTEPMATDGRPSPSRRGRTAAVLAAAVLLASAAALLLPGKGGSASAAGRSAPSSRKGAKDAFAVVRLSDLARRSPEGVSPSIPSGSATVSPGGARSATPSASDITLLPLVRASFPGKGDAGGAFPPDTSGAAGSRHVVSLYNNGLLIHRKDTGAVVNGSNVSLRTFWSAVLVGSGGEVPSDPFAPRILYDQVEGRYVAVSLEGKDASTSTLLLAVSATDDAEGDWYQWAVSQSGYDSSLGDDTWANSPALGLDEENLYVTLNVHHSTGGAFSRSRIVVVPRSLLRSPPSGPLVLPEPIEDPTGVAAVPSDGSEKEGFSILPVHSFGGAHAPLFVYLSSWFCGDFRPGVEAEHFRSRFLGVGTLVDDGGDGTYDRVAWGYVEVPGYSDVYPSGSDNVIQRENGSFIDWGGARLRNAVFRGGSLYTVHATPHYGVHLDNLLAPPKFYVNVQGYRLDEDGRYVPSSLPPFPTDAEALIRREKLEEIRVGFLAGYGATAGSRPRENFLVADPSGALDNTRRNFMYPSLAVNGRGDVAIGFSGVSATGYLSAYATGRKAGASSLLGIAPLKGGEGEYARLGSSGRIRWGELSSTCVDPDDDASFWTVQEYARAPGTTLGIFGTWWARLDVAAVPSPPKAGGDGIFGTGKGGGCTAAGTGGEAGLLFPFVLLGAAAARRRIRGRGKAERR